MLDPADTIDDRKKQELRCIDEFGMGLENFESKGLDSKL